ncbi:MAG: glutaminase A [Thermodesulfobacteriota bacterium]
MKITLFEEYLQSILNDYKDLKSGELADYIPELTNVDPELFGIAISTVDGHVYQVGDTHHEFTIQSISKPFVYGIALEDNDVDEVIRKVDVEPSGDAFNSISLEPSTGRPRNPMINAGAIATTGLVAGADSEIKIQRILKILGYYVGRELKIDNSVYKSESETGHRNKAISYLLRNSQIIERDPEPILDAYFKQCSILVNCRDLALMGATLANNGVNPITGVRAIKEEYVPKVLSIMTSCGMYDYSGAWLFNIGMPAKSGVGGGVVAVLPGQIGLAVFSPRLDNRGNSVRGLSVCTKISNDFGLHMLRISTITKTSVIRNKYDASQIRSKRIRRIDQINILDDEGRKILIFELSGSLSFVSAEIVSTEVLEAIDKIKYFIFDFLRISSINQAAYQIIIELMEKLISESKKVIFTSIHDKYSLLKEINIRIRKLEHKQFEIFKNIDIALEHCEDEILKLSDLNENNDTVLFKEQDLCRGLENEEIKFLENFLELKEYIEGEYIVTQGDDAKYVFFIISGQVSVVLSELNHIDQRIAVLNSGTSFGELAMIDRGSRSASVVADTNVRCAALNFYDLENDSSETSKNIILKLTRNIAKILSDRLRRTNEIVKSLS